MRNLLFIQVLCLHVMIVFSWPSMLNDARARNAVVLGSTSNIMNRSPNIKVFLNEQILLGESYTFGGVGSQYKFYWEHETDQNDWHSSYNNQLSMTPSQTGTYYVGLLHASGYGLVTVERVNLTVTDAPSPSMPPHLESASVRQDPHLFLAHGGRADFRGKNDTYYNILSDENMSLNGKIEYATFKLKNATIHGSFFTEVHSVVKSSDKILKISLWGSKIGQTNQVWANMTCGSEYWKMGPHKTKYCGQTAIHTDYASLVLSFPFWNVRMKTETIFNHISGPMKRIDVQVDALFHGTRQSHGIVGQSFRQKEPLYGSVETYPLEGEYTTNAWAEGAIEGQPTDYEMRHKFDTVFKHSQF